MSVTITPRTFGVVLNAKGDGTTDDTAAFQAAINAARGGKLFIPEPASYYKITDTLTIAPAGSDTQVFLDMESIGRNGSIRFSGVNKPLFAVKGWKYSTIKGVKPSTENTAKNAVIWDIDADADKASTSGLIFEDCLNSFGTGGQNIGWRFGKSGGNYDFSALHFRGCFNNGTDGANGDVGFHNMSQNGLAWVWENCGSSSVHTPYSDSAVVVTISADIDSSVATIGMSDSADLPFATLPSAGTITIDSERITYTGKTTSPNTITGCSRGAGGTTPASHTSGATVRQYIGGGSPSGGGSMTWINQVNSNAVRDFMISQGGAYTIMGGRFENGQRLISQYAGSSSTDFHLSGVELADYTPADEQVIRLQHPGSFYFHGRATRPSGSAYTAAFLTINHNKWAGVTVAAGLHAADPFHTVSGGATVSFDRSKSVKLDSSTAVTGVFTG